MLFNRCLSLLITAGFYFLNFIHSVASEIDCYVCTSYNGSDPHCGDPFHPQYGNLVSRCKQTMDGRMGFFPSRYCTKIRGTSTHDGTETVIRNCAIESLDNMCGVFDLEGVRYTGCVLTCGVDACNGARKNDGIESVLLAMMIFLFNVIS